MRRKIFVCMAFLTFLVAHAWSASPGFLKPLASDPRFLGNDTGFVQLRGMGLGCWMIQESYMMNTTAFANTQHDMQRYLDSVVGKPRREAFYQAWRDSFVTREDIDSLASWGFNAVRLPMHWNLYMEPGLPVRWKDEGFRLTDSLIGWCKARNMWVILDLHAAPGGQGNNETINDRDSNEPSLWDSDADQTMTVALWHQLADRYKNDPTVGGYDMLNETNWSFAGYSEKSGCWDGDNSRLRKLFIRITDTIRAVDQNHVVITEGNCYANHYGGLFDQTNGPWDSKQVISFHKYWDSTKVTTLNDFFRLRDTWRIPMWLGESGENSNEWHRQVIAMAEREKLGWSWWTLKRIDTRGAPLSVTSPAGWNAFLNWHGSGAKPDSATVSRGLDELIHNLRPKNCTFHPDYVDALFRQVRDSVTTVPWRTLRVPGTFGAEEYDIGREGAAYHDSLSLNVSGNSGLASNSGYMYRNDGVDIQWSDAEQSYDVGWISVGEWMNYTVEVDSSGSYLLGMRIAGTGGVFDLSADGAAVSQIRTTPTSGWTSWTDSWSGAFPLAAGSHVLRLTAVNPKANLGRLRILRAADSCLKTNSCATSLSPKASSVPSLAWTTAGLKVLSESPVGIRVFDGKGRLYVTGSFSQGSVIASSRLPGAGVMLVEMAGKVHALIRP